MIRKVYLDFAREKISGGQYRWLLGRGVQYALVHASFMAGRPFCGPILGTLVTNYRCNYSCSMCDLKLRDREFGARGQKEFDTAGMKQILKDFARLGVSGVGFTGGEPLLRKDIFELLAYTKKLGMISHLNTNGSLLDDRNIGNVLDAGVDSINISLDGACAETHDAIRGVPGAFERAVSALGRTRSLRNKANASLRIKTVAVIQERNIDEVEALVALSAAEGADCIEFIPRQDFTAASRETTERDNGFMRKVEQLEDYLLGLDGTRLKLENSPAHVRLFTRSFRNEPSPLQCYAGYASCAVDCYGEIYPCVPWYNWRHSAGNIQGTDLVKLWYSSEYHRTRGEVRACRKCFLNCQAELNLLFNIFGMRKRETALRDETGKVFREG